MSRALLLILLVPLCIVGRESALYYPAHGGRTGDKLIHLVKSLWVAHRSGLELYITPFPYSDHLAVYYTERHYREGMEGEFREKITVKSTGAINRSTRNDVWMTVGFFYKPAMWKLYEVGTWSELLEDAAFRQSLRQKIAFARPYTFQPPSDRGVTVALHIRRGGGHDEPLFSRQYFDYDIASISQNQRQKECRQSGVAEKNFPHKFPPMQYYVEALKLLADRLKDVPLYVYLYTDSDHPRGLIDEIEWRVNRPNITFDCHSLPSGANTLVLEDMIAMSRYDVLIRGGSNYPQISHLIGKHKLVIYPLDYFWYQDCLIMSPIKLHFDLSNLTRDDRHYALWSRFQLQ